MVCGHARRMEPSTLQFSEYLASIFIDQNQFLFEVSYNVSQFSLIAIRTRLYNKYSFIRSFVKLR